MSFPASGRTVVLGLGNPVVSDDRAGLAVAASLARLLEESPIAGVDVLVSTRGGFELIDLLNGYSRAILVDCLTVPDPVPGRIRRLILDDVAGSARLVNAHEGGVAQMFQLALSLGIAMPAAVDVLAIEGGDTSTLCERMTPVVAVAAAQLAGEIHASLLDAAPAVVDDPPGFAERRSLHAPRSVIEDSSAR